MKKETDSKLTPPPSTNKTKIIIGGTLLLVSATIAVYILMKLKDEKFSACKSGESGVVSANYNNEQFNVTCQDLFCNETMRNIFLNFTNRVYEILCAINNTTRGIKTCIQLGNDTIYNTTMWACKAALGVDPNASGVYSSVGGCNPAKECGYLDLYKINGTKN